jgi:hypothetical protein
MNPSQMPAQPERDMPQTHPTLEYSNNKSGPIIPLVGYKRNKTRKATLIIASKISRVASTLSKK